MIIVADENIPDVRRLFGSYGSVLLKPGQSITSDDLRMADVLLVRSVTQVSRDLLVGSPVKFVATATTGTDHVDFNALEELGITFAGAPGANADSVAEYVIAAVLSLAILESRELDDLTIGVVGVGRIGSRLVARLRALGSRVLVNDPPREWSDPLAMDWMSLNDVMQKSDVVTCHVPLNRTTPFSTYHLLDASTLGRAKPGSWMINTSRGSVVDEKALLRTLSAGTISRCVLDVWEGEPSVNPDLAGMATIGTAHIAGYGFDAKTRATRMILNAFLRHFNLNEPSDDESFNDSLFRLPISDLDSVGLSKTRWLHDRVVDMYDIAADDVRFREIEFDQPEVASKQFARLRKEYPVRRTFPRYTIPRHEVPSGLETAVRDGLKIQIVDS